MVVVVPPTPRLPLPLVRRCLAEDPSEAMCEGICLEEVEVKVEVKVLLLLLLLVLLVLLLLLLDDVRGGCDGEGGSGGGGGGGGGGAA